MAGTVSDSCSPREASPKLRVLALAAGLAMLAGCTTTEAPPPVVVAPPPPPPPVQLIPARPVPPSGAAAMMTIPAVGLDGNRLTINSGLTTAQTTWNLRSALNVAALNCLEPRHSGILTNYKSFLTKFDRPLRRTNTAVIDEFRSKYGRSAGTKQFDVYMTQVYNYFALPPAQSRFCDAALAVSADSTLVTAGELDSFAARALPQLEAVFENFFQAYENYERNLANWNATYGENAVPGSPVPAGVSYGSLAPTPGEQVLYGLLPDGRPANANVGTVEVLTMPAEPQVGPTMEAAPVIAAPLPQPGEAAPASLPAIDPGASDAASELPSEPAPSTGGIVFTSQPVVQGEPEKDE